LERRISARVQERHALRQHGEGRAQVLHPHALGQRRVLRQLVGVEVEQGLVVVRFDVVDGFRRLRREAGLLAEVVDLRIFT
jgi:hypothetical protein